MVRRFEAVFPAAERFFRARLQRGTAYGIGLTISVLVILLAMWFFAVLVEDVSEQTGLYTLDAWFQEFFEPHVTPGRTAWVRVVTRIGGYPVITILVTSMALTLLFLRKWWLLLKFILADVIGGPLNEALKLFFVRVRPTELASGYSFPSGHAFISTVFFGFIIYLAWTLKPPLVWRILITVGGLLMIFLIGMSRIYLNVHWATDVLAGHTGGVLWLLLSIWTVRIIEGRRSATSRSDAA
jgi:undecaprenyl-diphosphatase